ncbi:ABC transporter permease [Mycobacterium sp. CBMA247]|uniref:ABC transporter permease n=1 Tax=unclassified Mycolicibacterium TaxID=2636767 RepID=UPI0012DC7FCC|nr:MULTISPECIES: ABC transporter permease [unclassified Mycolicibacterium]MUL85931.1 ABC transporter permease [Mycolicibacterium sp. CBMA 329]MUM03150.1 ABC transporter permease [Mycolicibacterium sp. CBMA 334]MUM29536.1 ABC transporter permease [Mycolicibacterium sp. CBMA 295]MUM47763.1 ABC transporter permease [Mycolicibacterium sp. CBMA 294]MUL91699.1 ABC transporter permease [Mycolicibacterium sp. CBMA 331]
MGRPRLSSVGILLMLPALALVLIFFLYPVLALSVRSFLEPEPGLGQYARLLTDSTTLTILTRTLVVAAVVTGTTLLLSYPYAYLMSLSGPGIRALLLFLVLLPFWSSLMARTFSWIVLLQPSGIVAWLLRRVGLGDVQLLGSQIGVTIAMTQVLLPFMVLPLFNNMVQIDRRLVSAAYSMGASRTRTFLKVYLPLSVPGVAAGSVLVFILSLGFWVTPRLIGSPQQSLVGQLIETKAGRLLDFAGAGAISLVLLVITGVLLLVVSGGIRLLVPGGGGRDDG